MELMFHNLATQLWVKHTFRYGTESLLLIFEGQFDKTFIPVTLQFATQNYYKDIDIHKIYTNIQYIYLYYNYDYIYTIFIFYVYIWSKQHLLLWVPTDCILRPRVVSTVLCFHPSTTLEMKAWKRSRWSFKLANYTSLHFAFYKVISFCWQLVLFLKGGGGKFQGFFVFKVASSLTCLIFNAQLVVVGRC